MPRSPLSKSSAGPSTAAEDSEVECQAVASRVASVTLESDSLPDTPMHGRIRRRRRLVKRNRPAQAMDVDFDSSRDDRGAVPRQRMDWEGDVESELSTTDTQSSDGREADDEQSDWPHDLTDTESVIGFGHRSLGLGVVNKLPTIPSKSGERPPLPLGPPGTRRALGASKSPNGAGSYLFRLQRRLERFARDPQDRELTLEARSLGKERLNSPQLERLLEQYQLDVVRRYRGVIMLKKRSSTP